MTLNLQNNPRDDHGWRDISLTSIVKCFKCSAVSFRSVGTKVLLRNDARICESMEGTDLPVRTTALGGNKGGHCCLGPPAPDSVWVYHGCHPASGEPMAESFCVPHPGLIKWMEEWVYPSRKPSCHSAMKKQEGRGPELFLPRKPWESDQQSWSAERKSSWTKGSAKIHMSTASSALAMWFSSCFGL